MMRILLIGNTGQLGWELHRAMLPLGEIYAVDYPDVDLMDMQDLLRVLEAAQPKLIVNAAAYTNVDGAESNHKAAHAINAQAPAKMADYACHHGAAVIHYSTDYVFDGTKGSPYVEADEPNPLGVYGATKMEGEQAVETAGAPYLVLRTAWVYSTRRENFVRKTLEWARKHETLRIVSDQVSNPTWARFLAEATAQVIARAGDDPVGWIGDRTGIYHLAGEGYASRLDWVRAILQYDPKPSEQVVKEILPAATSDFSTPAQRPLFSALDCDLFRTTFGLSLPDWRQALKLSMAAD